MAGNEPKWKQQNNGFLDWLRTGKESFTLEKIPSPQITAQGAGRTPRFRTSKVPSTPQTNALPKSLNYKPNLWASLVKLSHGRMRADLRAASTRDPNPFDDMYGSFSESPSWGLRIGRVIRTVLLGIVQLADTLIYSPSMILAAFQLGFEALYVRSGRALGVFTTNTPYTNPIALFFTAIVFAACGMLATACRIGVFITKFIADGFGLLLNIANIGVAFTVGLATAAIKFITGNNTDLGSYTKIARATFADMVFPFSSEMGAPLASNAAIADSTSGKPPEPKPVPTPSGSTIFGYAVAIVAVGTLTFVSFGFGGITIPLIPVIAQFVSGAIAGGSIAAGVSAATAATVVATTPVAIATTAVVATGAVGAVSSAVEGTVTAVAENLSTRRKEEDSNKPASKGDNKEVLYYTAPAQAEEDEEDEEDATSSIPSVAAATVAIKADPRVTEALEIVNRLLTRMGQTHDVVQTRADISTPKQLEQLEQLATSLATAAKYQLICVQNIRNRPPAKAGTDQHNAATLEAVTKVEAIVKEISSLRDDISRRVQAGSTVSPASNSSTSSLSTADGEESEREKLDELKKLLHESVEKNRQPPSKQKPDT